MSDVNPSCEPPNINEFLPIQTDLSHICNEISNIYGKCLNMANTKKDQTSNENSYKIIDISNKWTQIIQKVKEQHDKNKTFIQSLEDKSDIRQTAEQIQINLDETLKEADKAGKIIEEAWSVADIYKLISILNNIETIIKTNIQNLLNSACSSLKKIIRLNNLSPLYKSTTKQKTFVLMIANSHFTNKNKSLQGIKEDVRMIKNYCNSNGDIFSFKPHENQKKKDMDVIIEQLRLKDFSEYCSILLIFTSHGKKDEVCTTDGSISVCRLWQWCEDNPTTCKLPLVVIVETCRSEVETQTQNKKVTTSHPNMQDMLIVYATAYGNVAKCNKTTGSVLLRKLLQVLEGEVTKDWDILAQITEASKLVFTQDKSTRINSKDPQTVNYLDFFQSQLKLIKLNFKPHDWKHVDSYNLERGSTMKAIFLCHPNLKQQAENLYAVMKNIITEDIDGIHECSTLDHKMLIENRNNDKDLLFIVIMGLATCDEIHTKHLPALNKELSLKQHDALTESPKVFLFLGSPSKSDEQNSPAPTIKETTRLNTPISSNSDFLGYCDSAPGWLESMQKILMAAPGNEEGLVRLLTTRGIARREALLSDSPPHIESSLRYKLVLPKTKNTSKKTIG